MKNLRLLCFLFVVCLYHTGFTQEQKNVTICWDVSLSMMDRDIEKEYYFLDAYFKTVQKAQGSLLAFSNRVISKNDFTVTNGNWAEIKTKLGTFNYDGATNFEALDDYAEKGDILMFTDGKQNISTGTPNFDGELYIVNSSKDFDRASINLLSIINNGNLVNLLEKEDPNTSKTSLKEYKGTIYNGTSGLAAADVYVKGFEERRIKSDEKGAFAVEGMKGDTLVIVYGNKKAEHVLDDNQTIDFLFTENSIQLQEVVVSEQGIEQSEEITTAYGKENKDKVGYAVQSISDEDIAPVSTTVNNAVQGKFSGVSLGQNEDLSEVKMRPSNSVLGNNYGLIVIDGVPMERSNSFTGEIASTGFIDPQNIADITVLKGLAATNRFGSMGANGVLLITTKTATVDKAVGGEKRDLARLKNNIYEGKIKVNNKTLVTPYLKELKKGKNLQEAYNIYLSQREKYWDNSEYLIDIYNFFYGANADIAEQILSNILEKEGAGYEELRGMYLKCLENNNTKLALLTANRILETFPNKIQSYFDVGMAHKKTGNHQEALNMFNAMVNGSANMQLNFTGMEKVVGAEIRNLVNMERRNLDISKVDKKYQNNLTYNARLVMDWNNQDAEFVVQFVNPQKRFFNWEHTDVGNRKRILDELQHGFSTEQFEIVGADTKGDWILNVTYLGNRTQGNKAPTFLKCTVQYNFGKPNQRSEEHVIRLQEVDEEQQLAKFTVQ